MASAIVILFVVGYIVIALEKPLSIQKAATALLIGAGCWILLVLGLREMPVATDITLIPEGIGFINLHLSEHLSSIAEILFFLLGAMTIVELIDTHNGFRIITDRIKTTDQTRLLWIYCIPLLLRQFGEPTNLRRSH